MIFRRGMRDKLSNFVDITREIVLEMSVAGAAEYDFCCFGVDNNGKLSDDRYMVFYNQVNSPNNEIQYKKENERAFFNVELNRIPNTINRLIFTVSIDGNGTMGEIGNACFRILQDNVSKIEMELTGADFNAEKAIIAVEMYMKDEWRVATSASGFNGGLSALLAHYGGTEITPEPSPAPSPVASSPSAFSPVAPAAFTEPPAPSPVAQPVKLEKISLKKGERVSLRKSSGIPIIVENGWNAKGKDYDLKALVRYRNGDLVYVGAANADEVLATPEGAVCHGGDVKNPGDLEQINISWHKDIASVAVSSYSARENGLGSFFEYGVYVRIKNGEQTIEIPAYNASAEPTSYTLCFGEIIYGTQPDSFEVSALEMYSKPCSEKRIGYCGETVQMDIGPVGRKK